MVAETRVRSESGVLYVSLLAPPMNLLGPEMVRDLVSIIQHSEADEAVAVVVFTSGDPDYYIAHVDVARISEYREHATALTGEPSLGLLFRYLSQSRLVTIAQIEGRVRGAGSEFVLACDMQFAARETAIFGQPELGFGLIPGAGGIQHLARRMGRSRALEVMLSADDYDADTAERYGWINRALPTVQLAGFVQSLAHRISQLPIEARSAIKNRVDAITLAPIEDFNRDSNVFIDFLRKPSTQHRIAAAQRFGFQTRHGELTLGRMIEDLPA